MCGNGVAIGMTIIARHRRRIQRDQLQALTAWAVAVVGAALCGDVVWHIVSAILPALASATLGFA